MEAMENPINELESLSSVQKEHQCGKDVFKASKEATVQKQSFWLILTLMDNW